MIFGERFYPLVDKLTNWRQSLFSLVLATHQYENFELWAEISENKQAAKEFKYALQQCWAFHVNKFNHIDLEECLDRFVPFIPEINDESNEGERFAFDASIMLNSAFEAISADTPTAQIASKASMASVIRLCENRYADEELDDEVLLDKEEISAEIDFQVDLFNMIQEPRSEQLVLKLCQYALAGGSTNIGLEKTLTLEELIDPKFINNQEEAKKSK